MEGPRQQPRPPCCREARTTDRSRKPEREAGMENKITLRGGGGFPKREGRKWKMGFAAQDGLVRVSAAPISEQLKALSVLFPPCERDLTREGVFLFF